MRPLLGIKDLAIFRRPLVSRSEIEVFLRFDAPDAAMLGIRLEPSLQDFKLLELWKLAWRSCADRRLQIRSAGQVAADLSN